VAEIRKAGSNRTGITRTSINVTDGALIPDKGEKSLFSAWKISFFGAIALLVILPIVSPDPFWRIIKFVPDGVYNTFRVTVISIFFALILGLLTGLGRISRIGIINRIATIYVEVIRGIPLLVQLFYIYYGLGILHLPPLVSAITAMSICYGAYMGEIFRAGILAIPKGQMEAALALGMSRGQALRCVILPQTVRIICPRWATSSSPCSRIPPSSPSWRAPTSCGGGASSPPRPFSTSKAIPSSRWYTSSSPCSFPAWSGSWRSG